MTVRSESAASPSTPNISYRLHRPRPGTVRLWTLHPKAVLNSLCQRGALYFDVSKEAAQWCAIACHRLTLTEADHRQPEFQSLEQERAAWDEWGTDWMRWPLSDPWQYATVPSWEGVFDLPVTQEEWGDVVQATFEQLEWRDVVAVTEFTARVVNWP